MNRELDTTFLSIKISECIPEGTDLDLVGDVFINYLIYWAVHYEIEKENFIENLLKAIDAHWKRNLDMKNVKK